MYLRDRPTYYTNGKETIAVHYTAVAFELEEEGWVRVEKEEIKSEPEQESVPFEEVLPDTEVDYVEIEDEIDLSSMTKRELVAYAEENDIQVNAQDTKAQIVQTIEDSQND